MGRPLIEALQDWAAGVVTNQQVDDIPFNASPRARNSALIPIAGGRASVRTRKGMRCINASPISGTPAIIGQIFYPKSGTNYHLLISDNGRFDKRNSDGTTSAADALTATPFTAGSYFPDSAIANDLAFICNGQEAKKFNGTTIYRWGIAAPTVAPTITASATAGNHNGTYEAFITYYNANTLTESARSPVSATASPANKQIDWNWTASTDAQVTHVKLYLRNTTTQPFFYEVASVAVGSTTYSSSVADTSLTVKGPDAVANQLPPTNASLCEWHYSRMFVSDGVDVFYSDEGKPEHFNYTNTLPGINRNDGEEVKMLHNASGVLIIAKESRTYLLIGDHPDNWRIELLDPSLGSVSHRSITTVNGVTRWWSRKGLVEWEGDGPILTPGQILLAPTISPEAINFSRLELVVGAEDPTQERILFALPSAGKDRNTLYIPYSYRLRAFESDRWEGIDAASLATILDSDDTPYCYVGGYKGQVFRVWDTYVDAVASGSTIDGTVTSATSTTLTVSGAAFDTTGNGLAERYVTVVDPAETRVQRKRIGSNTATTLTLDTGESFTDVPDATWTFIIGGIGWEVDTRWMTGELPFIRKRLRYLQLLAGTTSASAALTLELFFDWASTSRTFLTTLDGEGDLWDVGEWDVAEFGGASTAQAKKVRIARKAQSWRLRIRNRNANQPITLHKVGCESEILSDKNPA